MPDAPLRLAIVGLGRMGSVHLRALDHAAQVVASAVVDTAPAAHARARGLPCFGSVADLLGAGVADAALVAAPSPQHVAIVTTLLDAGVPVLCEKPLGLAPEDARAAGRVADRTGTPLMVAYWRRFVPVLVRLGDRIAAGELGEISLIGCWQWDAEPPPLAFRSASGGIAIDMGVHEFDQIHWLTGQRMSVLEATAAELSSAPAVGGDPEGAGAGASLDHALAAQADAFAQQVRTGAVTGATAADAVAALELAVQVG